MHIGSNIDDYKYCPEPFLGDQVLSSYKADIQTKPFLCDQVFSGYNIWADTQTTEPSHYGTNFQAMLWAQPSVETFKNKV